MSPATPMEIGMTTIRAGARNLARNWRRDNVETSRPLGKLTKIANLRLTRNWSTVRSSPTWWLYPTTLFRLTKRLGRLGPTLPASRQGQDAKNNVFIHKHQKSRIWILVGTPTQSPFRLFDLPAYGHGTCSYWMEPLSTLFQRCLATQRQCNRTRTQYNSHTLCNIFIL